MKTRSLPDDWQARVGEFVLLYRIPWTSNRRVRLIRPVTKDEYLAWLQEICPVPGGYRTAIEKHESSLKSIRGAFSVYHVPSTRKVQISDKCGYGFYLRVVSYMLANGCHVALTAHDLPLKIKRIVAWNHTWLDESDRFKKPGQPPWKRLAAMLRSLPNKLKRIGRKNPCPGEWTRLPAVDIAAEDMVDVSNWYITDWRRDTATTSAASIDKPPASEADSRYDFRSVFESRLWWSALMSSAMYGDVAAMGSLLDSGADVDAVTRAGQNAILIAALFGQDACVERLLAHGANIKSVPDNHRYSTLMMAVSYCNLETVKALVSAGSEIDLVNFDGFTALQLAEQFNRTEIAGYLEGIGCMRWPEQPAYFLYKRNSETVSGMEM